MAADGVWDSIFCSIINFSFISVRVWYRAINFLFFHKKCTSKAVSNFRGAFHYSAVNCYLSLGSLKSISSPVSSESSAAKQSFIVS